MRERGEHEDMVFLKESIEVASEWGRTGFTRDPCQGREFPADIFPTSKLRRTSLSFIFIEIASLCVKAVFGRCMPTCGCQWDGLKFADVALKPQARSSY